MNGPVEEKAIFQPLRVGNLVSLPLVPKDNSVATVLQHQIASNEVVIVWSYTGTPRIWKSFVPGKAGTLTTMTDGDVYWIYDTLCIDGCVIVPVSTPPTCSLLSGWTLVGFKLQLVVANEAVGVYLRTIAGSCDPRTFGYLTVQAATKYEPLATHGFVRAALWGSQ
jgi:hypothetical protein